MAYNQYQYGNYGNYGVNFPPSSFDNYNVPQGGRTETNVVIGPDGKKVQTTTYTYETNYQTNQNQPKTDYQNYGQNYNYGANLGNYNYGGKADYGIGADYSNQVNFNQGNPTGGLLGLGKLVNQKKYNIDIQQNYNQQPQYNYQQQQQPATNYNYGGGYQQWQGGNQQPSYEQKPANQNQPTQQNNNYNYQLPNYQNYQNKPNLDVPPQSNIKISPKVQISPSKIKDPKEQKLEDANRFSNLKGKSQEEIKDLANIGKSMYLEAWNKALNSKTQNWKTVQDRLGPSEKWVDPDFRYNDLNILVGEHQYEHQSWKSIKFRRPEEFLQGQIYLFQDKIEPTDILQGALGNCYFLSTIAAIAEFPNRIKNLFNIREYNKNGIYSINICNRGIVQEVLVDDFIPCKGANQGPVFTKGNGPELWVMILEKAWAKVNFSYDNIDGGFTRETLHDFTCAPVQQWFTEDQNTQEARDKLWKEIENADKSNFIMTAGSGGDDDTQELQGGIIAGHAYSVISAVHVQYQGQKLRLIKLRNPWGQGEWKGAWSDSDSRWNSIPENEKQRIGYFHTDKDGIFFMPFDDFLRLYETIEICYCRDDYNYSAIKVSSKKNKAKFFTLKIQQQGHYYVQVSQKPRKQYPERMQEDHEYSEILMQIGKRVGKRFQKVGILKKAQRDIYIEADLQPGEYMLQVKTFWKYENDEHFGLGVYGPAEAKIDETITTEGKELLRDILLDHAQNESKRTQNYASRGEPNAFSCFDLTKDGYFYVAYWNKGNKTMIVDLSFNNMGQNKFKKPYRGSSFQIKVAPGGSEIAYMRLKTKTTPTCSLGVSFK